MRNKSMFLLGIFALLTASAASAQKMVTEDDKVVFKKKTSIDFSDVNISGELSKPEGAYVGVRKNISFGNFIKVRAHFQDKLADSADNI
jgi:hypothetical protein